MCESIYPLKLPNSVKAAAERLTKTYDVSLNQFIAAAVAEKWHIKYRGCIISATG